jgi:hypothetical protein
MKRILLALNHGYLFFGTTLYVGVLWALHFFWFPSWQHLAVDNYYDQFPDQHRDPLLHHRGAVDDSHRCHHGLAGVVTRFRWYPIAALACLGTATIVGTLRIIPVNKIPAGHITDRSSSRHAPPLDPMTSAGCSHPDVAGADDLFFRRGDTLDAIGEGRK